MKLVVFAGPTLSAEEGRARVDAVYLGPASQGDVYRAALEEPWGIAIIDGYFARVPAVWHKEILWAMSKGVHVFGAASMGALRAAELHAFGMAGVGAVFEAFRDGQLEDDDEVTVIHGPEETGFLAMSEAMVNIRATLEQAVEAEVIDATTRDALEAKAKALYYPDRGYPRVLDEARAGGADSAQLARLEAWLPDNRVDQKKRDAYALLDAIVEQHRQQPGPYSADFHFERTDAWDQVTRHAGRRPGASFSSELADELILDELRLAGGDLLRETLIGALGRFLAMERALRHDVVVGDELFSETINGFFRERGILAPEAVRAWLAGHELSAQELTPFMRRQSLVQWASVMFHADALAHLRDHLRTTPHYRRIVTRARSKQAALQELGGEGLLLEHTTLSADELLTWFFVERRGQDVPADLDGHAVSRGFADRHALLAALLREHQYVTHAKR